ncbi:MAG TPA: error-prone DNA polymerase [Jatrophihabitans sp.]|nr:error-prone DNA polymerase [Jatrophihabitans sp.]
MGFDNPATPWSELERRLSGRPEAKPEAKPEPSGRRGHGDDRGRDGGDAPAWSRTRPAYQPPPVASHAAEIPYAELHAHSSFSFLDGASDPEQLVEEAVRLGLKALALTDHDGLYGVARFAEAAEAHGLPTVFGAELNLGIPLPETQTERSIAARVGVPDPPGSHLLVLARNPAGYASLCRAISQAQLRGGAKGRPVYELDELAELSNDNWLILTGCRKGVVRQALGTGTHDQALGELVERFGRANVAVELTHALEPLADERYAALAALAERHRLPLVATANAHYAVPAERPLATALAAVRARSSLDAIDGWLPAWAGQHLRSGAEMAQRFRRYPEAVAHAARLGTDLAFPLRLIAPNLPPFDVPAGHDEMSFLRELAYAGAAERYGPRGERTERAYRQIEHELAIIDELGFPGYFLVVWDLTEFCRRQGILAQGRGSAANSAVCYAIGITAVDSVKYGLLFERFLAPERDGPPDIDIDIESGRREEVIQYVYAKHGRQHAAQVANVITYRPRSAVRDVARALGYSQGQQDAWSKQIDHGYYWAAPLPAAADEHTGNAAGDVLTARDTEEIPAPVLELAAQLQNAPRHLGIHSGGMVICDRPVIEVCPVEWGRMADRTVLQWDKDDCAATGLVKFDLLGLGMLSALKYCFEFVEQWHGKRYDLHDIPAEDPKVYDMLCAADTIGVFQVESRAQMATLPRLKPRRFYDLVVEIALIRPGPIQGDSIHPYIRRKNGLEPVSYPHPRLQRALEKTYGIPLFQEQLMQLAIDGAGCTPAEADQVRRAMGSKRSAERMEGLRARLYDGMRANGISGAAADDIYDKIKAFAAFGFAESHAISFAFLVYASSWLKLYHPAAFCAALLNAQPMGFYSPQSLVQDAKRHGVVVRGPDLNASAAAASLEASGSESDYRGPGPEQPAVRLGLASVKTIGTELAERIVADRDAHGDYPSMVELSRRVGLTAEQLEALATAGAFDSLGSSRRQALWSAGAAADYRPGQLDLTPDTPAPPLPEMTEPEQLLADLWATGITRDAYPTALIRHRLDSLGVTPSGRLRELPDRTRVMVAGVVTHRQRPATARGVTFINLEDEFGMVNVVCDPVVWHRHRTVARQSGGLLIRGMLERAGGVVNVNAERIDKLELGIRHRSRDFR